MAKTVIGVFDRMNDAQAVIDELHSNGFTASDISMVANDSSGSYQREYGAGAGKLDATEGEQAGSGALAGAGIGAGLGLLVGLGMLAIPGIGPVLAAGPLATALGSTALGAGIGAAAGGVVGPLVDAGVPRDEALIYNENVRRGGTLVMVSTPDDLANTAVTIMNRHNVVDIKQRGAEYRSSGWTGMDDPTMPTREQEDRILR